jgi:hypothetical protein
VNVASPRPVNASSPLSVFSAASALLLRRWKIPVRMHLAGDHPEVSALRSFLADAGAKASGFSPAPSAAVPGEGFWKTTVTVVQASAGENFWAEQRGDKKVEWEPLLVALCDRDAPADLPPGLAGIPDLWCIHAAGSDVPPASGSAAGVAERWLQAGAGAVCVLASGSAAWRSDNGVFGKSEGARKNPGQGAGASLGAFAAGVVSGLIRELLEENLFEKTLIRADRDSLGMRPMRLGRACLHGAAALQSAATLTVAEGRAPEQAKEISFLRKDSGFAKLAEEHLALLRGPEAKPWGTFGRKERA